MLRLIAITFLSRFGTAALNFLTIVMLSRSLGPVGKGEASRMLTVLAGFQMLCDLAGGAALVYLSPRYRIFSLWKPIAIWTFLCSLLLGGWIIWHHEPVLSEHVWAAVALCFINAIQAQQMHLLNGREQFRVTAGLMFLHALMTAGILYPMLQSVPQTSDYFYTLCLSWGTSAALSFWMLYRIRHQEPEHRPDFQFRKHAKELFGAGSINQTGHLLQFLNQRLFYFLLPAFALGIYSNAVALAESIWMIASSMAMIQYGRISNMSNRAEAAKLSSSLFRLSILVSLPVILIVALLPESLYLLLFGEGFRNVDQSLRLLLPGVLSLSGYLILGHYFSGTGQFLKNNLSIAFGVLAAAIGFGLVMLFRGTPPGPLTAAVITSLANTTTFFSVIWLFVSQTGTPLRELIPGRRDWHELKTLIQRKLHG